MSELEWGGEKPQYLSLRKETERKSVKLYSGECYVDKELGKTPR